ncbi:MAG: NAD(P)-dependent oxidoreductase [Candidatus Dormiibacterota bacterium]
MRALVTGAEGQLGRDLCRLLPDASAFGRTALSVTDRAALASTFSRERPEVVFNCAADNGVDRAESPDSPAWAVNAEGPGLVAAACARVGATLVHFSTNYVFSGEGPRPWTEIDEPSPRSAYARSKLEGERRVFDALPQALVVRCAGLYGAGGSAVKGGSFPERILSQARTGAPLRVVDDQRLNPTATADLAAGVLRLVGGGVEGVVHLAAAGCCSWYEFAAETLRLAGLEVAIDPIPTPPPSPGTAARPGNGCLESVRVAPLRHWRGGLAAYLGAAEPE